MKTSKKCFNCKEEFTPFSTLQKFCLKNECIKAMVEAQNWPDGTFWSLKEQLEYAIDEFAGREKLNVELS